MGPDGGPAPAEALEGRDAVVHLAGENVAQRWSDDAKRRIRESRELGTRHLVDGLRAAEDRPSVLISSSAVGYYGPHGDEELPEDTPPGDDFLARVCVIWEREAARPPSELGIRVVRVRTGVVLDKDGGALGKMLPFFKAGVGGPVAGGAPATCRGSTPTTSSGSTCARSTTGAGAARSTRPRRSRSPTASSPRRSAARCTARRSRPVPRSRSSMLYGEMAEIVTKGQNAVPSARSQLGYAAPPPASSTRRCAPRSRSS